MLAKGFFYVNSSLDGVRELQSKYAYQEGNENMPIVVLIHGFNLTIDAIDDSILERIANQGFYAVAIGMRGRKGATGTRDASARELHDIYDGINYIKNNFPVSDKVIVSGYSGGGGNALGFAVKFPFVSNAIVNHFGMVDYGYDNAESWYVRNAQYRDNIEIFVGHSRTEENMNFYRSRNAYEALMNIQAKVFSFHDIEDSGVNVGLTDYLTNGLQSLSKPYETYISTPSDSVRYFHNMSVSEKTENNWLPYGLSENKPITPQAGNLRVTGYVVTDDFKMLLGNLDDHVADIDYNLLTNQFTVRPLTGTTQVIVQMNNLQQILTIDQETTFVFDGEPYEPQVPIDGVIKDFYVKQNNSYSKVKNSYIKQNDIWVNIK